MIEPALNELLAAKPPTRHSVLKVGPLSYYWIWINQNSTTNRHRAWVLSWNTKMRCIHLCDHKWWKPLKLFPSAIFASFH